MEKPWRPVSIWWTFAVPRPDEGLAGIAAEGSGMGAASNTVACGERLSEMSDDVPERTYDRSWEDIEGMLDRALRKQNQWKEWFEACRDAGDRDGMKEAARNHKALEGVIKTLRWTLGEVGVDSPLS